MARLPTYQDVGRRSFSGSNRIVSKDTAGSDLGLGSLAQGVAAVGGALQEKHDKSQDYAATQAQSEFLVAKAEADNAFDKDADYETIAERYSKKVNEALQAAGARIADPKRRDAFMLNNQVAIARGQESMIDLAFGKEAQTRRAEMQTNLQSLSREVALGNVLPADASVNARETMEAATAAGYVDPETAAATLSSFKAQTTVAGLARMSAEDRLVALGQDWTKDLPASEVIKLRNTAAIEMRRDAAIGFVDVLTGQEATKAEARAAIKSIEDPDLRQEVEARYDVEARRAAAAKTEALQEFNQDVFLPVRQGKLRVEEIPAAAMERFTPAQVNQLYAAQKTALEAKSSGSGTSKLKTNRGALTEVIRLLGQGYNETARDYIIANADKFSDGDYKSFLKEASPAPKPESSETNIESYDFVQELIAEGNFETARTYVKDNPEYFSPADQRSIIKAANPAKPRAQAKTLLTIRQRVQARAAEMGYKGKKGDKLSDETMLDINDWYAGQFAATGAAPSEADITAEIDRRLVNVTINPPGWFNTVKKKGVDMTPADWKQGFSLMGDADKIKAAKSLEARGMNAAQISPADVVAEFNRLKE